MKKGIYELKENKFGSYFIKNHKFYYLDSFDIWGLDRTLWYDKIDYIFYKVKFIEENGKRFISLRKTKETKKLESMFS